MAEKTNIDLIEVTADTAAAEETSGGCACGGCGCGE